MVFGYTLTLGKMDKAFFRGLENILIFYIGIKLEVASNNTPMVNFAIAINWILTHSCIPLQGRKIIPVGGYKDEWKKWI